jgi:hypothetical protein
MKRELLTIEEAIVALEKNWLGKKKVAKKTIYNWISDGSLTNYNPDQKPALLDKAEVIAQKGLRIA